MCVCVQTGEGKVLSYLGEKVREKYFPLYLEEISAFQAIYTSMAVVMVTIHVNDTFAGELKEFKERYTKTVVPLSLEYLVC